MLPIPRKFFVTSGKAVSRVSDLNAFDGALINAGIGYGFRDDGYGGYVAEGHMMGTGKALREVLEWKMAEMAKLRGIKFKSLDYKIEELSVPMDHYGACLAALVFLF